MKLAIRPPQEKHYAQMEITGNLYQERGAFTITASAKLGEDVSNLRPTLSRLADKATIRCKEHALAKADNSTRSPSKVNASKKRVGHRERKRILEAVESIENLYSKGEKLHERVTEKLSVLHGILNGQEDEPEGENLKENSSMELVRPLKRRKTSCEGTIVIHRLQDPQEPRSMLDSDIDRSYMCASPPGCDATKFDRHLKDGTNNIFGSNQCIPQEIDEIATHDYMKLLDLDNAADESSYRRAIAIPLSPTLPEVEFHGDEKLEDDHPEMLVDKCSQEELLNLQIKEHSVGFLKNTDPMPASDTRSHPVHVSGGQLAMSDHSGYGTEESDILCERQTSSTLGGFVKYFVVSSDNKDNNSILRILQTIGRFTPPCSFLHSPETFLRSILHTLLKAEDLSMKEKVCVFFSMALHGVSEIGMNLTNVSGDDTVRSLDSVTLHIHSALSDPVLRRSLMESCHLFELLAVIEDFLLQRKILVFGDVSTEPEALHSSKVNLVLSGNNIMLSEVVAPRQLLVAGGSLLASLCLAVDHIGFVCEMSCSIITLQKSDPAVLLAVLHSFAYICGSKYFTLQQYSIAMTLVKSLVILLEKQTLSTNSTSFLPPMVENLSKIWSCSTNCPFSEGAVSLEDVASLLLENLQKHGQSKSSQQDSLGLADSLVPGVWSHEERTEEVSGMREAVPLSSTYYDENLCAFIDILSLVEILASFMSWDWTVDHIIGQVCEYLESHLMQGSSAAIVVLLGQLGRRGVEATGYEDSGVAKLRGWLSALVNQTTFMKLSLSVQFAIVTALFGLTPIKFEQIVEDKAENPVTTSGSVPAIFIKEWFFHLSDEQQSGFRLHLAANDTNC